MMELEQLIEMESNPYGSCEILLDQVLLQQEAQVYKHSFLIEDLERQILSIIAERSGEGMMNEHLERLADDLVSVAEGLNEELQRSGPQEVLRVRTHQLAIAKLLVFTYGKSDFRLAGAHFQQGRAYLLCRAYEQAVNHLTIASTKISKISDIKETKLYNSFILTTLGRCYYEMGRFDFALEVLTRAYDIQNSSQMQKNNFVAKLTLQLLANTYLRLRPPEDSRLKKEKEEVRLKYQEEAVRLIDKLIDVLAAQFTDFENAHAKASYLADFHRRSQDSDESIKKQDNTLTRKKGEQAELAKLVEVLDEKLELLIVDFDRAPIRTALRKLKSDDARKADALDVLAQHLLQLLHHLAQKLKKQRIFKFKLLLSCALVTNSTDQELKLFMKEYEGDEHSKSAVKTLSDAETIQIYKLLLSYATRFSDNESQLLYLKKLEEIYAHCEEAAGQAELLNIRRALAKLYGQMHMEAEGEQVLEEIKVLQEKLFGPTSKPVRKTQSMLKLAKRESESQNLRIDTVAKQRLRKTVIVSNHAPRVVEI